MRGASSATDGEALSLWIDSEVAAIAKLGERRSMQKKTYWPFHARCLSDQSWLIFAGRLWTGRGQASRSSLRIGEFLMTGSQLSK